jgi:hypothetical protein
MRAKGIHQDSRVRSRLETTAVYTARCDPRVDCDAKKIPKWFSANFTRACDRNVHHACGSYILAT